MRKVMLAVIALMLSGASCQKISSQEEIPSDFELPQYSTVEEISSAYGCPVEDSYDCLSNEAQKRSMAYETFIMESLSDQPKLAEGHLSPQEALVSVKNSEVMQQILARMPDLMQTSDVYSSREIKRLSETEHWGYDTKSIQSQYDANLTKNVWSILIPCTSRTCDKDEYTSVLNQFVPIEGVKDGYTDLIFVVDALTGDVLFYQRGLGNRGDAVSFVAEWVPID
jgi:hypothetical protein